MKKISLAALAAVAAIALAAPASAADFSFTGNLANDDQVLFFNFTVGVPSLVTLRTYSYAGGTNAAGQVIARGGFDPILSLYDGSGVRVGQNDDGGSPLVAIDAVSGRAWDTFFTANLVAGSYTVAVSEFDNFGPANLAGFFPGSSSVGFADVSGVANNPRNGHWAFDVLNVGAATQVGGVVPEPATWGLMILGMGGIGAVIRRRRNTVQAVVA